MVGDVLVGYPPLFGGQREDAHAEIADAEDQGSIAAQGGRAGAA